MAKDKSLSKEERKALKKAAKVSGTASAESAPTGVTKVKSGKKEKKDKKAKLAEKLESGLTKVNGNVDAAGEVVSDAEQDENENENGIVADGVKETNGRPIGALVPFANPLADDKTSKKVFKSVKKAAATRTLKRGVKEVVKALRKSASSNPASSTSSSSLPIGIVILAADISPMDVISHIPVLCEDHNIPYIYVTSRAELGMASQTKRPTSVVMVGRDVATGKKGEKKEGGESAEEWSETFKGLAKVVEREGKSVKV